MYYHTSDIPLHPNQRFEYESSGSVKYIGFSCAGTPEDEPGWVIQKYEYDTNGNVVAIKMAEGSTEFKFKWSERDTYTYS